MPFETMPGVTGKVYIPEKQTDIKKHPCKDCFSCQMCSDDRCRLCRGKSPAESDSCVCIPGTEKSP